MISRLVEIKQPYGPVSRFYRSRRKNPPNSYLRPRGKRLWRRDELSCDDDNTFPCLTDTAWAVVQKHCRRHRLKTSYKAPLRLLLHSIFQNGHTSKQPASALPSKHRGSTRSIDQKAPDEVSRCKFLASPIPLPSSL